MSETVTVISLVALDPSKDTEPEASPPRDIDLAVTCWPTETMYLLNEEFDDLETMTMWGVKHGTVKIAFEKTNEEYEITSLDFKIKNSGNKITIHHNNDWKIDARDRDFTINSMSMDRNGTVYDYVGGEKDISDQKIKFNTTNVEETIKDTPLLMLRFFKLLGKFRTPQYDKRLIPLFKTHKGLLKKINEEAYDWFMENIKEQPYAKNAIKVMNEIGMNDSETSESEILNLLNRSYIWS